MAQRFEHRQSADATNGAELAAWRVKMADSLSRQPDAARKKMAGEMCFQAIKAYWVGVCEKTQVDQRLRRCTSVKPGTPLPFADFYGNQCSKLDVLRAGFHLGELYTTLLPDRYRAKFGVFYTAPELVAWLFERLEACGVDWSKHRILDPACGGAAFLGHVVSRVLEETPGNPEAKLRAVEERVCGLEIDPFAAWISQVVVDAVTLPFTSKTGQQLGPIVKEQDALLYEPLETELFDVVLGNPPFGKISLPANLRARYLGSLYGHANLYALFLHLAVRLTRPGGLVGFVLPTSFLAGEYFKNLRRLLELEAPLREAAFITERMGVFSQVLQETMLGIFRRTDWSPVAVQESTASRVTIHALHPHGPQGISRENIGEVDLHEAQGGPWLLPRRRDEVLLVRQLNRMTSRLSDYGYRVATGQLVWNRHKHQLRTELGEQCCPIVWAESVAPDGTFNFPPRQARHAPFIKVGDDQSFLINYEPCILVQRTTSKEQSRRLNAAVVPNEFVVTYPGYVVENHVNMIVPTCARPAVPLYALCELLNSPIADQAFRCISGSVAVSAYELEALPLPLPLEIMPAFRLRKQGRFASLLDRLYYAA